MKRHRVNSEKKRKMKTEIYFYLLKFEFLFSKRGEIELNMYIGEKNQK